jgi:exopolyphosphatase / guanosine-5'-triphosphate,3'-diphosphate pyrophosphatase
MSLDLQCPTEAVVPATQSTPKLIAVLDIGASAIRMAIAEIVEGGPVRTLENLTQAVSLGRDTFTKGAIDPETTEDCVRVLQAYREKLNEFGIVHRDQIHVVATSAVREASNRLAFLKRIYVATGFQVEPFDEAAVNRVTFLGVRPLFQASPDLADGSTLMVEVGGGSTQVLLFLGGDVTHAQIYRLGALRLRRTIETYHAPTGKVRKIMESQIQRCVTQIRHRIPGGDKCSHHDCARRRYPVCCRATGRPVGYGRFGVFAAGRLGRTDGAHPRATRSKR